MFAGIGADGSPYYWQDSHDCGSAAGRAANSCMCDINDSVWRRMEGNLTTATYGWAAFPPATFRNGDLGNNEYGRLTLGPLRCHVAGTR